MNVVCVYVNKLSMGERCEHSWRALCTQQTRALEEFNVGNETQQQNIQHVANAKAQTDKQKNKLNTYHHKCN